MGKKTSVFLLRKSSKKRFNFYEDYKLVGTTFDYSTFFKDKLFFDYWLKYTLMGLKLMPIDIFYSKIFYGVHVYIVINKKYLLTFKDIYVKKKYVWLWGFVRFRSFMLFRWLQRKRGVFYSVRYHKLKYTSRYKCLERFFLTNILHGNFNNFYFLLYMSHIVLLVYSYFFKFKLLWKRVLKLHTFFFHGGLVGYFFYKNFIYLLSRNFKSLFFFIRKLSDTYLFTYSNFYGTLFLIRQDKKYQAKDGLRLLNKVRWYSIKTMVLVLINKITQLPYSLFFLNVNDFFFLEKFKYRGYIKKGKKIPLGSILNDFKKIGILRDDLLEPLAKAYKKLEYKGVFCLFSLRLMFYFIFSSCRGSFSMNNYILESLFFKVLLNAYSHILFTYFRSLTNLNFVIFYYLRLNSYYSFIINRLWRLNIKNFYLDLKKNCKFFTTKDLFFKKIVVGLFFSFILEKPEILSKLIAVGIARTRKHHFFLNNIEDIILIAFKFIKKYKETSLKSITIDIKGKFNGKLKRGRRKLIIGEKIKLQDIEHKIKYAYNEGYTFAGTFGIKVWFNF